MYTLEGKDNIFLTGAGGTGKTHLIRQFIKDNEGVYSTASTGIASQELQGCTLHRLLGLQLCQGSVEKLVGILSKRKRIYNMWMKDIKVLVIDEISMLDIGFFIRAGRIIQTIHRSDKIWGNIRLILVGDFAQCPPVKYYQEGEGDDAKSYKFLFQHPVWEELNLRIIYLTKPYRTIDDGYLAILNDVRNGNLSNAVKQFFKDRSRKMTIRNGVKPTMLIGTNNEVDKFNTQELSKLEGDTYRFIYSFDTSVPSDLISSDKLEDDMKKGSMAPDILDLKVGAQVMHLINDADKEIYNGSRGVVIGLSEQGYPIVRFRNGKVFTIEPHTWTSYIKLGDEKYKMSRTQIPLKLAYALTIHKCQGCTLDAAAIMINTCFEGGMLYVGLSRCRSPNDLFIIGYDEKTIDDIWKKCEPYPAVIDFYNKL